MYAIHTTSGFIIDSRPYGEAGKTLSIFTRDLGLVKAMAQGIRLEKSKLRYHTRDYGFGEFSFVRGKDYWRLTSAEEDGARRTEDGERRTQDDPPAGGRRAQELITRIASLLRRLLHGEDPHPELFDQVKKGVEFLENNKGLLEEQMKTFESVFVLRILNSLGYVGKDEKILVCTESPEISIELLDKCGTLRIIINQNINKGLKESHL